ncbi:MAG: site-specific tyrosine recombinase XerD [Alphaproteobacteria bacterium]|nr:site-specific tyrosine recombinase XerD [Alphaproteobacteria bacterium]
MFEIDAFLEMMQAERGASSNTIAAYQHDLEHFFTFLQAQNQTPQSAQPDILRRYVQSIADAGYAVKTQSRRLSAIREFYRFLFSEGIIKQNPTDYLELPKVRKFLPKYLSEEDVNTLIAEASAQNIRLYTLLEVLYASGMRVSELVGLPVSAVTREKKHLYIIGKGNKERIVPLNDKACLALDKWLLIRENNMRPGARSKWLFPSKSRSGHLTRDGFFKELKKLALEIGLDPEKVSPHVFRHSFASHLVAHDADLRSVQKLLGHADIATTEIYTHILQDRLKKVVEKSHPLAYNIPAKETNEDY